MHFIRRFAGFKLSHPTVSGLWYAFLWMMIGALVISLLLQAEILDESKLSSYTYVVHSVAVLFGGLVSGKRAKQKGLYNGSLTGLIYILVLLLISFLALDTSLNVRVWLLLVPGLFAGGMGGAVGVNLVRK